MNEVYLVIEVCSGRNLYTLLNGKGKELDSKNWVAKVWQVYKNHKLLTNGDRFKAIKYWN